MLLMETKEQIVAMTENEEKTIKVVKSQAKIRFFVPQEQINLGLQSEPSTYGGGSYSGFGLCVPFSDLQFISSYIASVDKHWIDQIPASTKT